VQKEIKYQKIALEWATYANNAFNTLNNNAQKALYWCKLHDVDTNVQVEMHILEQTMDWHEAIIDDVSDDNKKLIKLSAKQLGQDYSNKFNDLSVIDEKNALLGKYAQTLLLIDRFLANTF
jgi:molecular chaperone HscB